MARRADCRRSRSESALHLMRWAIAAVLTVVWGSHPSLAQASVTGSVQLVSDYRFRGISASSRHPALQANVDVVTAGIVAGVWASTTSDYHGSRLETDWYSGAKYSYGQVETTVVGYVFVYPGGLRTTTFDVEGSVTAPLGNFKTSSLIAFSPNQRNSPKPNLYVSETLIFTA